MVEDVEIVGDGYTGILEVRNRADDVGLFQVARRIVVQTIDKNPRMLTMSKSICDEAVSAVDASVSVNTRAGHTRVSRE